MKEIYVYESDVLYAFSVAFVRKIKEGRFYVSNDFLSG